MTLAGVPAIVLAVLGIIGVIAAALAVAKASYAKAQIEALRGDRDDQSERITRLEREKEQLRVKLEDEIRQREALEKVVTGKQELEQLAVILRTHDQRARNIEQTVLAIANHVGIDTS